MNIVLEISFLFFSNIEFWFDIKVLTWRFYTIAKALHIISWVKLVNKWEFAQVVVDKYSKTFIVHIANLETIDILIHLSKVA